MSARRALASLAVLSLALALAACGGGTSTTTGTTSAASAPRGSTTASTATSPAAKAPAAKPSGAKAAARPRSGPSPKLIAKAGHARAFLVPVGDNSIPTYGGEASGSQEAAASAALGAYLSARAKGDWSSACSHLGGAVRRQIAVLAQGAKGKVKGCAAAYAALSTRVPASQRADPLSGAITALRVKDAKAFALFYGPHRQQYMMPMASEGGAWKVNQIEAVPWPIGAAPSGGG